LGLQWQWQANSQPHWHSLTPRPGWLRLFAQPVQENNLYAAPHLLLQKFPGPEFTVDAKLEISSGTAGLIVFGCDYAWIGVRDGKLVQVTVREAHRQPRFTESVASDRLSGVVQLRVRVTEGAACAFAFSIDGENYSALGEPFKASVAQWVGAKVGLFASGASGDFADFDHLRVTPSP
jgi:beta-xylosidase